MDPERLLKFATSHSYIVIDSEGECQLFTSLRDIGNNLSIDHSTVSKRLKNSCGNGTVVTSRITGSHYFITRHGNSHLTHNEE